MSARPIVIAGGGTAGHVTPALAVGRVLAARDHHVTFVGSKRGLEARLVPEAGFDVVLLPGRGIVRKLRPESLLAVLGLVAGSLQAFWYLVRHRPSVILSVGGYAAVPCAVCALVLRIPLVVAEANAVPGATNRIAGRWAKACAVAFEGTGLPRAVRTGNPIPPFEPPTPERKAAARADLGLPAGRTVIAVTGGSLGARSVNRAVIELAGRWADRADLAIHHAIGRRDWPELSPVLPHPGALAYQAVEYEDRMGSLLTAADVWIGRAGATTMAELTGMGVPAVLVPLPIAPNDHQAVGARQLEAAGAAVVILDKDLNSDLLAEILGAIVDTPGRRDAMAVAALSLGRPDAADRVADLVEEHRRD